MSKQKVVLAYSGGLDTSVILKWLEVEHGYEVIAVCVDVGQTEDFEAVKKKALSSGATKAYVADVKEEFVKDYVFKGLKAGAVFEEDYLLGTAYARPLISKKLVQIAEEEGAFAIAHGATGKGNDQVRFETTVNALNPYLKIIAPWRTWDLKSREDCIDYAMEHGIAISNTKKDIYSRDENVWHLSHEGGELEETWTQHNPDMYKLTSKPEEAPDEAEYVDIEFYQGEPIAINGKAYSPLELVQFLNKIGGKHGVGVIDIVENRLIGMKSRGVYETPGGTILYEAHKHLEKLVLDRRTLSFKKTVGNKYAELIYDGLSDATLMDCLHAFVDKTQEVVTGMVKLKLYKGRSMVVATQSEFSLYNEEFVTFGEDDVYDQSDAEGFINLFSLPLKINAINKAERELKEKQKEVLAI